MGAAVTEDELSSTFAALADPTRRAMLSRLATGEATVNQLAAPFDISLQAISKHLKVLEQAGLITRGRNAQFRPCRFEGAPLGEAVGWIEQHRQIWEQRLDALGRHLHTYQQSAQEDTPIVTRPTNTTGPEPMTGPTA